MHVLWRCLLFFFFQAEDGIRDWSVTGVQTCALPIYELSHAHIAHLLSVHAEVAQQAIGDVRMAQLILDDGDGRAEGVDVGRLARGVQRSEERRVGKEWRCRWWRWHEKDIQE